MDPNVKSLELVLQARSTRNIIAKARVAASLGEGIFDHGRGIMPCVDAEETEWFLLKKRKRFYRHVLPDRPRLHVEVVATAHIAQSFVA